MPMGKGISFERRCQRGIFFTKPYFTVILWSRVNTVADKHKLAAYIVIS